MRAAALVLWLLVASGLWPAVAAAGAPLHRCDRSAEASAGQQDRLLRVGALIRAELEGSGQRAALIARSGLDLRGLGLRYSHAGVSLADSEDTPWSVRQLYYACDEGRPRIFDQGLGGFLLGVDDPELAYVSIVLLPQEAGADLARVALDKRLALGLLGGTYSANAHPASLKYQNCNQWLAELLALSRGAAGPSPQALPAGPDALRAQAQAWLRDQGYAGTRLVLHNPLWWLAASIVPWVHTDDHPIAELQRGIVSVSLPQAIEAFVRDTLPGARRVELCHTAQAVVIRRGWTPIADGCRPEEGDTVVPLDA